MPFDFPGVLGSPHLPPSSHYEPGGKSAKLLAFKLKKQQFENTIHKIKDPQTNTINWKIFNKHFLKFYRHLYSQPRVDASLMNAFLDKVNLPTVSEEQNKSLTSAITELEIKKNYIQL